MSANEKKNYYDILEISRNASQKEIDMAYIRCKNAYSEDSVAIYSLMNADDCSKMVESIEEAYSVLCDPDKRKLYNEARGLNVESSEAVDNTEKLTHPEPTPQTNIHFLQTPTAPAPNTGQESQSLAEEIAKPIDPGTGFHREKNSEVCRFSAVKKFALEFNRDESFEQEIENTQEFSGDFLRKIREYKNVSIKRMSEMTKILKTYLHYIEDEDFERLPATAYTRGFVFQYAKCLKLNPDLVSNSYLMRLKKFRGENLASKVGKR
jgi:curved DNA-binding protein CbpA